MKLFFNPFMPGGIIEKIAKKINPVPYKIDHEQQFYDGWICKPSNIIEDRDTFITTAKRLYHGQNVGICNMQTLLKVACQHYLERVKPESIDGFIQRAKAKKIIDVIEGRF